jgi:hypothetical protein
MLCLDPFCFCFFETSLSSCLSLSSAGITGMHHPIFQVNISNFLLGLLNCSFLLPPFIFIRMYSLYRGHSLWQFRIGLYCTLVRWPPLSLALRCPSLPYFKQLQEVSLFCFIIVIWSPPTIFPHLNLIHSPSPLPQVPHSTHTVLVLQSCLSLLISMSMFKEVSPCIPAVIILYFGLFNPFLYSPLSLASHPSFQQLSIPIVITSIFTDVVLSYCWHSIFLFYFPSFPKFYRVVQLLQTCSIILLL